MSDENKTAPIGGIFEKHIFKRESTAVIPDVDAQIAAATALGDRAVATGVMPTHSELESYDSPVWNAHETSRTTLDALRQIQAKLESLTQQVADLVETVQASVGDEEDDIRDDVDHGPLAPAELARLGMGQLAGFLAHGFAEAGFWSEGPDQAITDWLKRCQSSLTSYERTGLAKYGTDEELLEALCVCGILRRQTVEGDLRPWLLKALAAFRVLPAHEPDGDVYDFEGDEGDE